MAPDLHELRGGELLELLALLVAKLAQEVVFFAMTLVLINSCCHE